MPVEYERIAGEWVPVADDNRASTKEAFHAMLEALQAIDAHWQAGNIYRTPKIWEQIKSAIQKAKEI